MDEVNVRSIRAEARNGIAEYGGAPPRDNGDASAWSIAFVRHWRLVLSVAGLAAGLYATYHYALARPEFRAVAVALAPAKRSNPLDALVGEGANAGRDLGLNKLMRHGLGEIDGYNVLALMESNKLRDSLAAKYRLAQVYDVDQGDLAAIRRIVERVVRVSEDENGPISVAVDDPSPERAVRMANDAIDITNGIARDLSRRETQSLRTYVERRYREAMNRGDSLTEQLQAFIESSNMYFPEQQMYVIENARIRMDVQVAEQRTKVELMALMLGPKDPQLTKETEMLTELQRRSKSFMEGTTGVKRGVSLDRMPENSVAYLKLRGDYEVNARTLMVLRPLYDNLVAEEGKAIPVLNILDPARLEAVERTGSMWMIPLVLVAAGLLCLAGCACSIALRRMFVTYAAYRSTLGGT